MVDLSKVNKRVLHSLIAVGCFDELGINRASLLSVYDKVSKDAISANETQMNLFGGVANKVEFPDLPPMSLEEKLKLECDLLGVCVTGHEMDAYAESCNGDFVDFNLLKDDMEADVFGMVKRFTKIVTKNGDDMAFMDISNKTGDLKVTIFPRDFENMKEDALEFKEGVAVKINGRFKEDDNFGDALIAKTVAVCKANR